MHLKFAAIDVGSNGVRLLLARVMEDGPNPDFKKETLVRMPIRLGADVFAGRAIAPETIAVLVDTMRGFRHLILAYQALRHAACATAAMREAVNGADVSRIVRGETGIDLQIIDGTREAELIALNAQDATGTTAARSQLHVDIGGGSTELTLLIDRVRADQRSFPIGTLRVLQGRVHPDSWRDMKSWLREIAAQHDQLVAVGSGGNINKLFSMSRAKEGKPLTYKHIKSIYALLRSHTLSERIHTLHMRPDRADVIVPATEIVLSIMKWAKIARMMVPEVGLADGLIHLLHREYREEHPVAAPVPLKTA
jgi:exopolyphosphatase/guanosine-5'-triphosphate,3'-diphosphate pyrophosphatase